MICSTILVLFTDIEGDVWRWLRQPSDLGASGRSPVGWDLMDSQDNGHLTQLLVDEFDMGGGPPPHFQ